MTGKSTKILRWALILLLLGTFSLSSWQLYKTWQNTRAAQAERDRFAEYAPEIPTHSAPQKTSNPNIATLQSKYPDVVGWLRVEGSSINAHFAQGENNAVYLRADLDKKYLDAGTLFLDSRCDKSLADFHSIIYGHNMRDGSLFGELKKFAKDPAFFNAHPRGWIALADETLPLAFFAIITVHQLDPQIYGLDNPDEASKAAFLAHVKENAQFWRDVGQSPTDRFVSLSTCEQHNSEYRFVLVGRIEE
ncbi:MAG: class B sortase [Oscillospiraceae bacterium]|jgi:sortase B|nr:class B sortase [Oscillospiraceae bacterium]